MDENEILMGTKNIEEVKTMKEGLHPAFYQATVTCNCGNTFVTGSTILLIELINTSTSLSSLLLSGVE